MFDGSFTSSLGRIPSVGRARVAKSAVFSDNGSMLKRGLGRRIGLLVIAFFVVMTPLPARADSTLQSPHYQFDESVIGTGGMLNASSANYQATSATGDIVGGDTASTNYQVTAGSKTSADPALGVAINTGAVALGNFSASTATTASASFSVSNYTSYGYVVQIVGTTPEGVSHTIPGMTTSGPSNAGVEQFGINLVANTIPASVGANVDNGQFGAGTVAPNYGTPNSYRYVSGETIAMASKSSGLTTYTMSYLVNVAGLTPGGQYTSGQTLIVTGTY